MRGVGRIPCLVTGGRNRGSFSRPRKGGREKVELGDAIQRILRRHWMVIVLALVVGLAIPAVAHDWDETQYIATSRLVIDAADPKNSQASTALADAEQVIVTTPVQVASA